MSVSIVLVRPQFAGNLGSVARAMKNMGLSDLRLVEPEIHPHDGEAQKMAVHAKDILKNAKVFSDLPKALEGFHLVAATSRRSGKDRAAAFSPRQFAESLLTFPQDHKIAILFGTEDKGLTNEEITFAQQIISIPSDDACPSLNLAQSVMVIAYEIFAANFEVKKPEAVLDFVQQPATFEAVEGMYQDFGSLLEESGFLDKNNPEHMMRLVRNFLNRARPTVQEVSIVRGISRQLRWWAGENKKSHT